MTTSEQQRQNLEVAIFNWVASLGIDAVDFDYSAINEALDDVEAIAA